MDSSGADPDLHTFGPDDIMLDQMKNTLGFENLSQDWDAFLDPATHQFQNISSLVLSRWRCQWWTPTPRPRPRNRRTSIRCPTSVTDGWQGDCGFNVTVRPASVSGRQLPYVFSNKTAKLYMDMMVAVPFCFTYAVVVGPSALHIRGLPIYNESHHIQTLVRRCPNRRAPEDSSNIAGQLMDVVHAERQRASYHEETERCSVSVPLKAPEPGTEDYQVLFNFSCMNNCVGGITRRRLLVLFTLEERSWGCTLGC